MADTKKKAPAALSLDDLNAVSGGKGGILFENKTITGENITGSSTVTGTASITGASTVTGASITNSGEACGTLTVTGASTVTGQAGAVGAATLTGDVCKKNNKRNRG